MWLRSGFAAADPALVAPCPPLRGRPSLVLVTPTHSWPLLTVSSPVCASPCPRPPRPGDVPSLCLLVGLVLQPLLHLEMSLAGPPQPEVV